MTQHTPGPWAAWFLPPATTPLWIIRASGPDGKEVARLPDGTSRESDELRANSSLIAAAPELLAALEGFVAWDINPDMSENVPWEGLDGLMAQARAAIAKAKGVQP